MAALQWHHPQSQSTFWTPRTVPTLGRTCQHHEIGRAGKNTSALMHTRLFLIHEGRVHGLTLTSVDDTTPWHSLPHHPSIKPTLFLSLLTLSQHALAWGHSAIVPTSLFWDCVAGTLPVGTLAEAHKYDCEKTISVSFHRLFFLPKLSFILLFLLQMIQCWWHCNTTLSNHQMAFV